VESYLDFSGIDWKKTKAYGFGMYGNIHINLQGREPQGIVKPGKQYEDVRNRIISKLLELRDPNTGDKIVEKVYKREELYHGPFVEKAPDLLIKWKDYCYYTSNNFEIKKGSYFGTFLNIDSSEYKHVGTHRLNGIFMAMGPVIKKGVQIDNAEIVDLAPTILYFLGQPIPEDMDGRVLNEIFLEDFLVLNPPEFCHVKPGAQRDITSYSKAEAKKVRERLKALGYIE